MENTLAFLRCPNNHKGVMGVVRFLREAPPAHFKVRLESFSLLSTGPIEKYESDSFEVGGYKWKLLLYPNGIKHGGDGYVSMYLSIAEKHNLPTGWDVKANFKMFVYNHKEDKYMTIQDNDKVWRFHDVKCEWGYDQLLSIGRFYEPSTGYLREDSCIFGVEIFVIDYSGKGESLSIIQQPKRSTITLRIPNFSAMGEKEMLTHEFREGDDKWKFCLYPKGDSRKDDKNISIYLTLADGKNFPPGRKVYADFKLSIKNQLGGDHFGKEDKSWFSASNHSGGFKNFMPRMDLNNLSTGFIKDDVVLVEVQLMIMSVVTSLS